MITTIDIQDLPARLAEALAIAASGGEVIVTGGTVPRARIVPYAEAGTRIADLHAGAIRETPDFDSPLLDDFWIGHS